MSWDSLSHFLDMGGYGLYVWGSYAVTLVCIVGEVLALSGRKRTLMRHLSLSHQSTTQEKKNEATS